MTPSRDLDAALDALEEALQGTDEQLLIALLGVWRHQRSASIAETLEELSPRLFRQMIVIEDNQQWHIALARWGSRAVPALLAMPWRQERHSTLYKRLIALTTMPPDPRIAAFAEEILRSTPSRFEISSAAETLRTVHGRTVQTDPPRLSGLLSRARAKAPGLEQTLLDAVIASPEDDAPRFVYADYLMGLGDPLGEYIVQALRGVDENLDAVLSKKRERWCRALLGARVEYQRVVFRRGFPHSIDVWRELPALSRRWTVEQISIHQLGVTELAWLPSLRVLPNLRSLALDILQHYKPPEFALALPHLSSLSLRVLALPVSAWSAAYGSAPWTHLARLWLWIERPVQLDWSLFGEIAQRPFELGLVPRNFAINLAALVAVAAAASAPEGISQILIREGRPFDSDGYTLTLGFARDSEHRLRAARLSVNWQTVDRLAAMLRPIDAGTFSSITIESRDHADLAFQSRTRRAMPRFKGIPLEFVAPRQAG